MKAIRRMGLMALFAIGVFSCNTTTPENSNGLEFNTVNVDDKEEVVLEVKTEYGADSSFKMEYQVDTKSNMKHGTYKEYGSEGNLLVERSYKKNKMDGVEKRYFENGKVDGEFTYKNGLHEGPFVYYYEENGNTKQKGTYVAGKMEGMLNTYYSGGQLKEEVMHVAGFTQGVFKEYNENGSLKAEGEYTSKSDQENLEHGLLKEYSEEGELSKKMICKTGQCCTIWTLEDGEVKPSSKLCQAIVASQQK
jgi:antitoxin component YwqK of YwqJK toxin-antitoxin module